MLDLQQLRVQQRNRINSGGRINRQRPVLFKFAGRELMGYEGDTLAAALLANGVDVVGRSFKYARPRGIMTAGVEEPNAIMQVGSKEAAQTPNIKATEQSLYPGLECHPVNGWPNAEHDLMGLIGRLAGCLMPPGFYYKTFMWPKSQWETYENLFARRRG